MSEASLAAAFARAVDGPDDVKATLGEMVAKLESRGYGVLLFLFAAPNLTPGPSLPGFSTIFALPLMLIAAQMALGIDSPKLPIPLPFLPLIPSVATTILALGLMARDGVAVAIGLAACAAAAVAFATALIWGASALGLA